MYFYSRNLSEFGKLIAVSIETLLSFCDDEEPDVRLVAGDCVNRIIKVAFNNVNSQGDEAHQGVTHVACHWFCSCFDTCFIAINVTVGPFSHNRNCQGFFQELLLVVFLR